MVARVGGGEESGDGVRGDGVRGVCAKELKIKTKCPP